MGDEDKKDKERKAPGDAEITLKGVVPVRLEKLDLPPKRELLPERARKKGIEIV